MSSAIFISVNSRKLADHLDGVDGTTAAQFEAIGKLVGHSASWARRLAAGEVNPGLLEREHLALISVFAGVDLEAGEWDVGPDGDERPPQIALGTE